MREAPLLGGNVADAVVRSGDTVRKPWTAATPAVAAYLRHLAAAGFDAAPRFLGRDERGRQVLSWVPGDNAEGRVFTAAELRRLGALVRRLHDASASFVPPPGAAWDTAIPADGADLVCHHDLAPWNLIVDGGTWTFVDWDAAGPGTRLWDLAYVAQTFTPLLAGGDPAADAPRLCALADGYELSTPDRAALAPLLAVRARAMHDLLRDGHATGRQPWARLWAEGHGEHWGSAADYCAAHTAAWAAALVP